ncbi:hypothetical protein HY772_02815 [Candidatus Woesearchaeota archaeon]|nr:hypothetical protein [Candidatus Woesearchaeota archaeon]
MKKMLMLVVVLCFAVSVDLYALNVTAESVSSGIYEDGEFTPGGSGFKAEYVINELEEEIVLREIFHNDREGHVEEGMSYEITNIVVSGGPSALNVSINKKGQKIITAVRESDLGAFETIIMGSDFYEFCRAYDGKLYLEYGKVTAGKIEND